MTNSDGAILKETISRSFPRRRRGNRRRIEPAEIFATSYWMFEADALAAVHQTDARDMGKVEVEG